MNPPRYSVVIPLYNKGPHIERAIDSVLAQSLSDFEVLVVDDASSDDGPERVRRYDDPRIRLLARAEGPGPGASPARNLGVGTAAADWVAFLDADDEWDPGFLRAIDEARDAHPDAILVSTGWIKKEPGGARFENAYYRLHAGLGGHQYALDHYLTFAAENAIPVLTSVAATNKKTLVQTGGFPEGPHTLRGEDEDTWLRIMLMGRPAAWAPILGAVYHRDAQQRATRSAAPAGRRTALLATLDARLAVEPEGDTRRLLEAYRAAVLSRVRRDTLEHRMLRLAAFMLGEDRLEQLLAWQFNHRARRKEAEDAG